MTIQKIKPTKLVQGHGTNDLDEPVKINGKPLKFYDVWYNMLKRCYSEKSLSKHRTYVGCSVCSSWLLLSTFRAWFDINYRDNTELDKDILVKGNKIYSPDTCRFVPHYINSLLCDSGAARGDLPCGVIALKPDPKTGKVVYRAQCWDGNGKRPYKNFKTIPEARQWYITTKKKVANEQAVRAFEVGDITEDVYQALIAREW